MLIVEEVDWRANIATVVSGVITLIIAQSSSRGSVAYHLNRYKFRQKSKAVEEFLRCRHHDLDC